MISPCTDIVFKKIFTKESNKDLLISFINAVVSPQDQITDLTIVNPYTIQNYIDSKILILDINAKALDGRRFNIEMQVGPDSFYDKRALYYWSKLYSEQLGKENKQYSTLIKTIGIHILSFSILSQTKKYHSTFHMIEKNEGFRYFNDIEIHIIELSKFADPEDPKVQFMNNLDMWAGFLSENEMLDPNKLPDELDKNDLKKALKELDVMTLTKEERWFYEGTLDAIRVRHSEILTAEIDAKIEIAKKMLEENMPIDMIIRLTGLTREWLIKFGEFTPEEIEKFKL